MLSTLLPEPLLSEESNRYSLYPIKYPHAMEAYRRARESTWEASDIDFTQDKIDWKSMPDNERSAILGVIAFFQVADGIVAENAVINFYKEITVPEIRLFYGMQIAQEGVHQETYSLTLQALVDSEEERQELNEATSKIDAIKKKTEWGMKWMKDGTFSQRVLAFGFVEGLFFSSSFCIIFWFKKNNKMPGLTFSNEYISREEKQHCDFASYVVWPHVVNKENLTPHDMARHAVECEKEFVRYVLPSPLPGMNAELMCQYVEFIADRILVAYGYQPIYGTSNPFTWMNLMGIPGRASFFEKKVADYVNRGEIIQVNAVEYDESNI